MYIYKIINNINDKVYVGQTTKDDPKYYGAGKLILKAITKYGVQNFKKSQKGVKWSEERKERRLKNRIGITYKKPV